MNKFRELLTSRKVWLTVAAIASAGVAVYQGSMPLEEGLKLIAENLGYLVVALGLVDAAKQVQK